MAATPEQEARQKALHLISLLDPDAGNTSACVKAWAQLEEIGDKGTPALREALSSTDRTLRFKAGLVMGALTGRWGGDPNVWLRWLDEKSRLSFESLIEECRTPKTPRGVEEAVAALVLFHSEKAPPRLVELIATKQWHPIDTFAHFGNRALQAVQQRLRTEQDPTARWLLIGNLGKYNDVRAADLLAQMLSDKTDHVRAVAIDQLLELALRNPCATEAAVSLLQKRRATCAASDVAAIDTALKHPKIQSFLQNRPASHPSGQAAATGN